MISTSKSENKKPTPRYDETSKEVERYQRLIIWIVVPEICQNLRDEYKPPDFRRGYTNGQDLTDEEVAELGRLESIKVAKHKAIKKCEGVTYFDKVMLNNFGIRRWWYEKGHYTRINHRGYTDLDGTYIPPRSTRGKWVPRKRLSKAFKYTEFIINQWAEAAEKGEDYIKQQTGPWQAEGIRPMQWLSQRSPAQVIEETIRGMK